MKQTVQILGILFLTVMTAVVVFAGYRVVVSAGELPGRLVSVARCAENTGYIGATLKSAVKIEYMDLENAYMEAILLAKLDIEDMRNDQRQMDEIRAINDLTAMSELTAEKEAYEQALAELEAKKQAAQFAAQAAAMAESQKREQIAKAIRNEPTETGYNPGTPGSSDTAASGGRKGEPVYTTKQGESMGKFTVTAYCTCKVCCGVYSGRNRTASGTIPTSNRTIAVDTSVIPFGTKVVINGQVYVAEDRGSAIVGNRIDMFFMTHIEAARWGRKVFEVYKYAG